MGSASTATHPHQALALTQGWQLASSSPGTITDPEQLANCAANWHAAIVPGTVAESLRHDIGVARDFDAEDWWYRSNFARPGLAPGGRVHLRFEGLATLAEVWLNGQRILRSENMFMAHSADVTDLLQADNSLVILFKSLRAALAGRRARPRWKTALVEQQNLRWYRTTLLGRIPGWTPPVPAVGPWRAITLECLQQLEVTAIDVQAGAQGDGGWLRLHAQLRALPGHRFEGARLRLGDAVHALAWDLGETISVHGDLTIERIEPWWPHSHGEPRLHECLLELRVDGAWLGIDCGPVGFKRIVVDQADGGFRVAVNDVPVFCRGACWTTADVLRLRADEPTLRRALLTAREAGLNMLRLGGTMVYESTEFYRLCDELGILVWQDFMFANMDYPVEDPDFHALIDAEARAQLGRLQHHACVAAYCGGSEVAQQAAMLGRPAAEWTNRFFADTLPHLCATLHAGIPYQPSTPWGGALPFHVGTGISHYYGVGAYRRPLDDVKHAGVKFTTECLGFSNVPDPETTALLMGGIAPPPHHPRWKARVPRDTGPGWDFEDIRDHYLRDLFGVDPVELRSIDLERYYALSRVVTGEVMQSVYREWRKPGNPCGGGLVWFFQDLWPGAGWGIVDSTGRPKAAYWYLRRAWSTLSVRLTDEGLDGLNVLLLNETSAPLHATLDLALYQSGRIDAGRAKRPVDVPARGALTLQVDALLGYFADTTSAYRFGPPRADVITVRLSDPASGAVLAEDHYFPGGLDFEVRRDAVVSTEVTWSGGDELVVVLRSNVFLQSVSISCRDFAPSDNYFHLSPECDKPLVFRANRPGVSTFKAEFAALNLADVITVRADAPA